MTIGRVLLVLALASALASASASTARSSLPGPVGRAVFVAISGQGSVTSAPRGIACPKTCRAFFTKDARVRLVARSAAGWKLLRWGGWCVGRSASCAFNLTTSHECSGGLCRVGAFGVRVSFVRVRSAAAQ